jgi:hypothetical protein
VCQLGRAAFCIRWSSSCYLGVSKELAYAYTPMYILPEVYIYIDLPCCGGIVKVRGTIRVQVTCPVN